MFRKIFKQKVGVEWEARDLKRKGKRKEANEENQIRGEDGADDERHWDFFGPLRLKQQANVVEDGALDGEIKRRPSATVIVSTPKLGEELLVGVQAKTPEGGW